MQITDAASEAGSLENVPDALATMTSARRMCKKAGFRDIPAYTSKTLVRMRFMGLDLDRSGVRAAVESRSSFLRPKTNIPRLACSHRQ